MSIGYGPSVGPQNLNSMLGTAAVARRNAARLAFDLWSVVHGLGNDEADQVAALRAMGGWIDPDNDPQAFWTSANYLYADAQSYYGIIDQAKFNTDDALAPARGGQ